MSILRINSANPGVKRPLKVEDLANLWEGIESALAQGTDGKPRIICGFDVNDYDEVEPGIIAFNGHLYMYDGELSLQVGFGVYAAELSTGDTRVLGDGTTQIFSYARVITDNPDTPGAVLIGTASVENLEAWKAPLAIPGNSILTPMLANGSVTGPKLADESVTGDKIADESITGSKLADGAVKTMQLANSAVQMAKIAYNLRPCTTGNAQQSFTMTSANQTYNLPTLIITPNSSGYNLWDIKTLYVSPSGTGNYTLTIMTNGFGSNFADMPAYLPLVVQLGQPGATLKVRVGFLAPNNGNPIFTDPVTLSNGQVVTMLLVKSLARSCYTPVSMVKCPE
jgi:hypothetical protein